jgi:hypothetical protein
MSWDAVWNKLKTILQMCAAPGIALIIIAGAVLLVCTGFKNIQIGGLLGKLFGKKDPDNRAIDVANSVPKDRVDANGKIIPQGEPDSHGMTQAVVVPIDHVEFTPPGESKPTTIVLPTGVKAKDVEHVIVVKPGTFAVTVKDGSGITGKQVDDLLKKYKS